MISICPLLRMNFYLCVCLCVCLNHTIYPCLFGRLYSLYRFLKVIRISHYLVSNAFTRFWTGIHISRTSALGRYGQWVFGVRIYMYDCVSLTCWNVVKTFKLEMKGQYVIGEFALQPKGVSFHSRYWWNIVNRYGNPPMGMRPFFFFQPYPFLLSTWFWPETLSLFSHAILSKKHISFSLSFPTCHDNYFREVHELIVIKL